jgi:hypothetical protein
VIQLENTALCIPKVKAKENAKCVSQYPSKTLTYMNNINMDKGLQAF